MYDVVCICSLMLEESFEPEPAGDIHPVSGNLMSCNYGFAPGKIKKL